MFGEDRARCCDWGLGLSGSSGLFEVLECHMGWGRMTGTARGHVFPLTWRPQAADADCSKILDLGSTGDANYA